MNDSYRHVCRKHGGKTPLFFPAGVRTPFNSDRVLAQET